MSPEIDTVENNISTFGLDVRTTAYVETRAALGRNEFPHPTQVRAEEFINYFDYNYPPPSRNDFSLHAEIVPSSRPGYHMISLALKARDVYSSARPPANIVFVIDLSASMGRQGRLTLIQDALALSVEQLSDQDRIAMVAYGITTRALLPLTPGNQRGRILSAIGALQPEGSTSVQQGLHLAYQLFDNAPPRTGLRRIVLCSDGVGDAGADATRGVIVATTRGVKQGISLSTVGVVMGNYNDALLEALANRGHGSHAYVDTLQEARRVFSHNLSSAPQLVARDAKLQLVFDPDAVVRYRLIGYDNGRDPHDTVTAVRGDEIRAGHAVTAIYEVQLRTPHADSLGLAQLEYTRPGADVSRLVERQLSATMIRDSPAKATAETLLSLTVAAFAEKLRGSPWSRNTSWADISNAFAAVPEPLRSQPSSLALGALIDKAAKIQGPKRGASLFRSQFERVSVLK